MVPLASRVQAAYCCLLYVCVVPFLPLGCWDLQLSPVEAYQHLQRILEQVNVIASEHVSSSLFAASDVS